MQLHPDFLLSDAQKAECIVLGARMDSAIKQLPAWRADRLISLRKSMARQVSAGDGKLLARWMVSYRLAIESELISAAHWVASSEMAPVEQVAA